MTSNTLIDFNRQQTLKEWEPIQPIQLFTNQIQYFEQKIQYISEKRKRNRLLAYDLIELEEDEPVIDNNYLKYVALKHIDNLIQYIKNKGVILEDIEWNIKLILNEIITSQVSEDYYLNTIDIYKSIDTENPFAINIYNLINQAIRLNNKRMLYYLIFMEDEELADKLHDIESRQDNCIM